ncbi:MAG: SpoIID/LytB domain-containing protein [Candidatus Omnitrophota bacterium]
MKKLFIIFIMLCLLFYSATVFAEELFVPEDIRVVIADSNEAFTLSIKSDYTVRTIETAEVLKEGKLSFDISIKASAKGICFGKDEFKIYGIEIVPKKEPAFYFGKRLYGGTLQIIRTKEGSLRVINIISLEDYLKGVLYKEISHRWPIEAIKAQAIACRTFALYQAQQNKGSYYYLKDDVSSQVYGGVFAQRFRTDKAVDMTRGKVLLYEGKFLPAFFHATCAGATEDSSQLWKVSMPPLKGRSCLFCKKSPHYFWKADIKLSEIEKALKKSGHDVSGLRDIRVIARNKSGRVTKLNFFRGALVLSFSAKDLRHILGPSRIRSTRFNIKVVDGYAHFSGTGWGHGVGLCQWGARGMAQQGRKAQEILAYYYPGSQIVKLD